MQDLRESVRLKKNRSRFGEEIDTFITLFRLSNKLIPKRIRHRKPETDNQIAFTAIQNVY